MCGIAGLFAYRDPGSLDLDALARTSARMACRGPDGEGLWTNAGAGVALAHRRLAIIDLSAGGAQPMTAGDGAIAITYNGEIYNYRSLRRELEADGETFRTESDTEVILRLWARKGPEMLGDLRGMFAFVLWDAERGGCLLARDPYGIKPLYHANDGSTMIAASQVRALLASGAVSREPEPAGEVGFLLWGHVPEPHTLVRAIRAVPSGSWTWIGADGREETRRYASVSGDFAAAGSGAGDGPGGRDDRGERLRAALLDTVEHHFVSDVEVGLFLSAGLDSTTLAGLAAEREGRVRTVTLGFETYRGTAADEVPLAERVADLYGTRHETVWLSRRDFAEALEGFLDAMDQPTLDGMNTYFVSRAAAEAGLKVALSGLGGDELLGGYPSFRNVPLGVRGLGWLPRGSALGRAARRLAAPFVGGRASSKWAGALEYGGSWAGAYLLQRGLFMPWELPRLVEEDRLREGWEELRPLERLEETVEGIASPRARVAALESCWYMRNQLLRDADWAGMAHSLEIRVPFVDRTLLRALAPLVAADPPVGKRDLPRTLRTPLPAAVVERPKTGFTVPYRQWMGGEAGVTEDRGLRGWARWVLDAWRERA